MGAKSAKHTEGRGKWYSPTCLFMPKSPLVRYRRSTTTQALSSVSEGEASERASVDCLLLFIQYSTYQT
ncbi:hypothetical protein QC763_0047930 [Podospora pseudopauciseta]|uniref:Uncharacterized protein n=2 Tax=Podospora TaxID=5144 RepID=A0ABR0HF66_9PEZI|nr:hypothetical protein QC763_0047930 [Podospora pseudopauciseta]KAK4677702.1 hypothetical protein QC764_0047550 [Podospora pseudoanserina]